MHTFSQSLPIYFNAFDLLNRNGELLVGLPIERRRELLVGMLAAPEDPLRLSPLLRAPPGQVLEAVRKLGLEGVVGKRIGSIYEPGEGSGVWIKHRTNREQDFVIGGYIPGSHGFDALLVGVYENKKLIFVAKVKAGFMPRIRDEIFPALKKAQSCALPVPKSAREKGLEMGRVANRGENEPMPIGQTEAGLPGRIRRMDGCRARLRHYAFVAMRDDKKPAEVVRETDDRRPRSQLGAPT